MARKRAQDQAEDDNRRTVDMPDNPGQTTEEVDNAVGSPERSEAPRPDDGQPELKVRSGADGQSGEVLSEQNSEPLPSQYQERTGANDPEAERRAFEESAKGGKQPNIYAGDGSGAETTAAAREHDIPPAGEDEPDDPRSDTDKAADLGTRALVDMPDNPGVTTEIVKGPASTDPFLDTADQAGEAPDRTLGGVPAADDSNLSADPDAPREAEEETAELTIWNTRIGGEPGREMRDTTLESADKDTPPADYSGTQPEQGVKRTPNTVKLSDIRRMSGGPQSVDLKAKPIRHADLAEKLLREGYKLLREGGRGDDAHYLRTALNLAVKLQPKLHAKITGRR